MSVAAQAQHRGTGAAAVPRGRSISTFWKETPGSPGTRPGRLTVSADWVGKMQQYCATYFKVGGTIWNRSFTCTNKHYKHTSWVYRDWTPSMLVCLHSEMLSPTILQPDLHDWQGFTVILLFSSFHICLLSLLSSVNCVSQFTRLF